MRLRRYDARSLAGDRLVIYDDDARMLEDSLARAVASGADLARLDMADVHLDGVDLTNARLAGAVAQRAVFVRCNLTAVDFKGAAFEFARFEQCELGGAAFSSAAFRDSSFRQCDLWGASFRDSYFWKSSFVSCSLCDVDFTGADLYAARFRFSDLSAFGATEWQEARANLAADKIPWRSMEFLAEVLRRAAGRDRRKLHLAKLCWASRHVAEFARIEHPDTAWAMSTLGSLVKVPRHAKSGARLIYPEALDAFLSSEVSEWISKCKAEEDEARSREPWWRQ
jgi:hypothetical protein